MVALPAERTGSWTGLAILDRDSFMSCLASMLSGKEGLRWTKYLPAWFPTDDLHLRLNGESQGHLSSTRHPTMLLVFPQTQHRMIAEQNHHTHMKLAESGCLQSLIDQRDKSNLEELEAFIDTYFEMVWEQTIGSFQPAEPNSPTAEQAAVVEETGEEEVLSSIDRKLSKLELLEEIRRDLVELRKSLEHSWKATKEEKSKQDDNNTC